MPGRRRSVRLAAADYAAPGLYFVTVVAAHRAPLFGRIVDGVVRLSCAGQVAHDEWVRTGDLRPTVARDAFVAMPDHVHLLFGIVPDAGPGTPLVCPRHRPDDPRPPTVRTFGGRDAGSVAAAMRQYKPAVTKRLGVAVWQRGFHDRIVRDARERPAVHRRDPGSRAAAGTQNTRTMSRSLR